MRRLDEVEQLGLGAEPRRHAAFLVKLAEIVVIVWVVTHRFPVGGLVRRRHPQGSEASFGNRRQFRSHEAPPGVLAIFRSRTIPIKALQHHTHKNSTLTPSRRSVDSPAR